MILYKIHRSTAIKVTASFSTARVRCFSLILRGFQGLPGAWEKVRQSKKKPYAPVRSVRFVQKIQGGDPTGNRTRDSAVRGLRLNRLTIGPRHNVNSVALPSQAVKIRQTDGLLLPVSDALVDEKTGKAGSSCRYSTGQVCPDPDKSASESCLGVLRNLLIEV